MAGIDDDQGSFAGGEAARHLVAEVDVARGVDEIEQVRVAVVSFVDHRAGLGLDRDTAFAFDIHAVEHLLAHLTLRQGPGELDQAVGEGRFAVIDVCNNTEVSNEIGIVHGPWEPLSGLSGLKVWASAYRWEGENSVSR